MFKLFQTSPTSLREVRVVSKKFESIHKSPNRLKEARVEEPQVVPWMSGRWSRKLRLCSREFKGTPPCFADRNHFSGKMMY